MQTALAQESDHNVTWQIRSGIADVRLNRPQKHNAIDTDLLAALARIGIMLRSRTDVRAVVFSGNGPSFCSGLDFDRLRNFERGTRTEWQMLAVDVFPAAALGQQAVHVWSTLPVPVIAAIHGVAFGGGLQLALGADIRIVDPSARLSVKEIDWGLVPDMMATALLPELVGRDVAKELTLTGREVDGREAVDLGLATRVHESPLSAATELAVEIASRNPDAIRAAKALLDSSGRVSLAEQLAAEQVAVNRLIGSANQSEAVRAKMARRPAQFRDFGGTSR
ncbi:MAG: crotonase/enoyl-CoA hydratase family protein [Hyphomicrobiales bacterium]|nr:MAG: crotonase/enoyl-CoA hydratase family protein [Hyphomicrobiales bacterium]